MTDQPDPYAPPTEGSAQPAGPAAGEPPPYASAPAGSQPYGSAWGAPPGSNGDYGSWGRRVGGRILDALCIIIPAAIVQAVSGSRAAYDLVALALTIVIAYMNGAQGQSPGKRAVGLKLVRDSDGSLIGGGLGIVRELAHLIDSLAILIGWFWPLWDAKRQTFADKIMGTVVVRT